MKDKTLKRFFSALMVAAMVIVNLPLNSYGKGEPQLCASAVKFAGKSVSSGEVHIRRDLYASSVTVTDQPYIAPEKQPEVTLDGITLKVERSDSNHSGETVIEPTSQITEVFLNRIKDMEEPGRNITGEIRTVNTDRYETIVLRMKKDFLEKFSQETNSGFRINNGFAAFTFGNNVLDSIYAQMKGFEVDIIIKPIYPTKLDEITEAKVDDRPAYSISVNNDETGLNFGGEKIKVSVPYTLRPGENKNSIIVYSINKDGSVHPAVSKYDQSSKAVIFITDSPGEYTLAYNHYVFSDIDGNLNKDSIDFIASREIFSGVGDGKFGPDLSLTRGMLVTILGKISDADASGKPAFEDVPASKYYSGYVAWASKNGLLKGTGKNRFEPERAVTREELASIMYNFTLYAKLCKPDYGKTAGFADDDSISGWAANAVAQLKEMGLVSGDGNNMFNPKAPATRAEAADILTKIIIRYIDKF